MKFASDIDGCLIEILPAYLEEIEKRYGVHIEPADVTTHKIEDICELTGEQVWEVITHVLTTRDDFPEVPGAKDGIRALSLIFSPILFLTDRRSEHEGRTRKNIEDVLGPQVKFNIVHTSEGLEKKDIIKSVGITHYVEDNAERILGIAEETRCKVFAFMHPWTEWLKEDIRTERLPNLVPVENWNQILIEIVKDFEMETVQQGLRGNGGKR